MSGVAADRDPTGTLATAARRAVRGALAVRLDDIGQLPDWLTPEARRAVVTYAHGGKNRLQMVLATALFLAEKEHRPRVDLALVQRAAALQSQPAIVVQAPAFPPAPASLRQQARQQGWRLPLRSLATAGVMCVATAALALLWAYQPAPIPQVSPVSAGYLITLGKLPLTTLAVQTPKLRQPGSLTQTAAESPSVGAWRPAAPPSTILLKYTPSPNASAQVGMLRSALEKAGFAVTPVAQRQHPDAASLRFFYAEDRHAAARVQQALALTATEPRLVPATSHHAAPPPPGTIELYLP